MTPSDRVMAAFLVLGMATAVVAADLPIASPQPGLSAEDSAMQGCFKHISFCPTVGGRDASSHHDDCGAPFHTSFSHRQE